MSGSNAVTLRSFQNGDYASNDPVMSPRLTEMRNLINEMIRDPNTGDTWRLLAGRYMHALADTYSHRDQSDIPYDATSMFDLIGTGHALGLSGPDLTFNSDSWPTREARTLEAQRKLYNFATNLANDLEQYRGIPKGHVIPWDGVGTDIHGNSLLGTDYPNMRSMFVKFNEQKEMETHGADRVPDDFKKKLGIMNDAFNLFGYRTSSGNPLQFNGEQQYSKDDAIRYYESKKLEAQRLWQLLRNQHQQNFGI